MTSVQHYVYLVFLDCLASCFIVSYFRSAIREQNVKLIVSNSVTFYIFQVGRKVDLASVYFRNKFPTNCTETKLRLIWPGTGFGGATWVTTFQDSNQSGLIKSRAPHRALSITYLVSIFRFRCSPFNSQLKKENYDIFVSITWFIWSLTLTWHVVLKKKAICHWQEKCVKFIYIHIFKYLCHKTQKS